MIIPSGLYKTNGGSALNLIVGDDGQVRGTYCSIHGQPEASETFPIVGIANGDLIAFVTSWGKYRSMTSWSGRFGEDDGRACIRTVWHLVRAYADKAHTIPNDHWESFLTYTGTYYKVD